MKFVRFLTYTLWLLGIVYFLYVKIIYTSLSKHTLESINYSNKAFEKELRKDQNFLMLKRIKRTASSNGYRPSDIEALNATCLTYSLYSKCLGFLDSIKQNHSFIPLKSDSLFILECMLASTLDSIQKDSSKYVPSTKPISLTNISLSGFDLLYSTSEPDYSILLNTTLIIKRHYLHEVQYTLMTEYSQRKLACDMRFVKTWVLVRSMANELEEGKNYEADIYLAQYGHKSSYFEMSVDYGEGEKKINKGESIQFVPKINIQDKNRSSLRKWKVSIDNLDTTLLIETNYTVRHKRE